jgi:hypothetical protein
MRRVMEAAATVALLSVAAAAAVASLEMRRLCRALPGLTLAIVHYEAEATRKAALDAIDETRRDLLGEIAQWRTETRELSAKTVDRADARLMAMEEELQSAVARLLAQTGELAAIRGDVQPILRDVGQATAILTRPDALPAQTLGLIAGWRVTGGEVAQTMREFRKVAPDVAANASRTVAAAAGTAEQVQSLTKPSRWYWRLARVAAPVLGGWVLGRVN